MRRENISKQKLIHSFSGIFLAISALVLILIGIYAQNQDLINTYTLAEETMQFLVNEFEKFDNYNAGLVSSSLQDLLDTGKTLRDFIDVNDLENGDFLNQFIRTEHVGGVIVIDENLQLVSQADMDEADAYKEWEDLINKDYIKNIVSHPQKSYVGCITLKGEQYNYAVVSRNSNNGLIFCYSSTVKPAQDPYEITVEGLLKDNSFYKNPTVVISDGSKVLSTNNKDLEKMDQETYQAINKNIVWKNKDLTEFSYDGENWYGVRQVYASYNIYVIYPSGSIFVNRSNIIVYGFMVYLVICLALLVLQRYMDKQNMTKMKKQLNTIEAISSSFTSTFLLHLSKMTVEPIKMSDTTRNVINEKDRPEEILEGICRECVLPEFKQKLYDLADIDTLKSRLKGKKYLETEVKDIKGVWYSVLLIGQTYDNHGEPDTILIATRDISEMKKAEELSYKDELTGLYNRNYMETYIDRIIKKKEYPISLIMADCNYLKRTNDTLGHEYGDMLLKKTAQSIRENLPPDAIAMRIGGDEFLTICFGYTEALAQEFISKVEAELRKSSDDRLTLSVSFGIYTMNDNTVSFDEACSMADKKMYTEKNKIKGNRRE